MNTLFPTLTQFFLVGRTLKSHGTGGHIRVMIERKFKTYLTEGTFVFFDLNGSKVPYRIEGINDDIHYVLALEDITNKRDSDLLSGLDLWVPLEVVKPRHQQSPKNISAKWDEYNIEDESTHGIYPVIRVEEYPQQLMAVIKHRNREILIPLSEPLISLIDKEHKVIRMTIPEGLLDL